MQFSEILDGYAPFESILTEIGNKSSCVSISGVAQTAAAHIIYEVSTRKKTGGVVLCYSDLEAQNLYRDLKVYTQNVCRFPNKEYVFFDISARGHESERLRLAALYNALSNPDAIIVAGIESVLKYTADKDLFFDSIIDIKTQDIFDINELCKKLVMMGYVREDIAESVGQFSVRGGILDVFSPQMKDPVRIEFFDDEVDSVRSFDADTQRTVEMIDCCSVIPCTEAIMSDKHKTELLKYLSAHEEGENSTAELSKLSDGEYFASIDKYIYKIFDRIPSLFDYTDDRILFISDPKRIAERAKAYERQLGENISELKAQGVISSEKSKYALSYSEFLIKSAKQRTVLLDVLATNIRDFNITYTTELATRTSVSFHGKTEYFLQDLGDWVRAKNTVLIFASNEAKAKNIGGVIEEHGIKCVISNDKSFKQGEVTIVIGSISRGFEYPEVGFVTVSDKEIFGTAEVRRRSRVENANRIKSYNDINPGDYVVHRSHGIGIYRGIKTMTVSGVSKDYLTIDYKDSDVLYVPVEQLDILYKYTGAGDKPVKINKLSGSDWSRTKSRVKKSTDDMAKQLVALYKKRENARGYEFSPDTTWQRDFEDKFRYHETDDQLRSIEEVKADMENAKPMDRLLCGDVGFGKTEVALRAAFKAVTDGKQVAYLCPTTILCMQHYNTFAERMSDFPIKVEMLSRFRTPTQQKKIIEKLKTGEIDVIVGTHRLLGKDVEFSDLGLLVIDEEQRFGVAHKEKLKQLKTNIDVLSMTATPIPRTLHMSMISVRDMSLLTEPPENRYPVETFVSEFNPHMIVGAISNELSRGGQVFYLYNRVSGIYAKAEWLKSMFPDARVSVGHGKMSEAELEDIMYDMVSAKTDILVCTTIIETGLDIPNANTIIIEDADRMGLSQLYQLRGRVGRSNRTAYAYFTYRPDKMLSETAEKRLRAIREFTRFGSGFKIAMRDLEIRGAGNIIGSEQHGHMDSVGYDMYCKLLKESVDEACGIETEEEPPVTIDLEVNAYLPERYIKNAATRIDMYKKIAAITSDEDKMEIEDELCDRFGDLPRAAKNVVEIGAIKAKAQRSGVFEIYLRGGVLGFRFTPKYFDIQYLLDLEKIYPGCVKPILTENPVITVRLKNKSNILKTVRDILAVFKDK